MPNRFLRLAAPILYITVFFTGYYLALALPPAPSILTIHQTLSLLAALAIIPLLALFAWLALKHWQQDSIRRSAHRPFIHLALTRSRNQGWQLILSNLGASPAHHIRLIDAQSGATPPLPNLPDHLNAGEQHILPLPPPTADREWQLLAEYHDSNQLLYHNPIQLTLPAAPRRPMMY